MCVCCSIWLPKNRIHVVLVFSSSTFSSLFLHPTLCTLYDNVRFGMTENNIVEKNRNGTAYFLESFSSKIEYQSQEKGRFSPMLLNIVVK